MTKSILQNEKVCYRTGSTLNLHKHHVFGGAFRNKSEKYGLYIYLRSDWHNMTPYAIHIDKKFDLIVKQIAQRKFEEIYGHDKFMEVF
ncbi:MAG: hypothetical protein RR766_07825, partial [Longicatena sp.]